MNNFKKIRFFLVRFSIKEQTLFVKRLSFLINAEVPIVESLGVLRAQTKSKEKAAVLDQVIVDVSNGQLLSTSLQKHKRVFSDFVINLIRVGESSGTLGVSLSYLADELKKKQALKTKVIGALLYPACIAVGTVGVTVLLIMYIFPKILPVFTSLQIALPLSTRILVGLSSFLSNFGLLLLLLVVVAVVAFFFAQEKWEQVRWRAATIVLAIPLVKTLVCSYNVTNFCRTLGLLLRSGMRLSEALVVTAGVTKNVVYKYMCLQLSQSVQRGESVSQSLVRYHKIFPDIARHLIAIGERTGTLAVSLVYVSDIHESDVDEQTKHLSSAVEPILMVVMGLVVGFVAVAVITPMYEITSRLTPR
jgi:type II secretory pathway component PulF